MDIEIKTGKNVFKARVAGCVIKNNKILVVKMGNNDFYCLPGGHIRLGETSNVAVKREVSEETMLSVKNEKLMSIVENFFDRKNGDYVHELCFYYIVEPQENVKTKDFTRVENDEGEEKNLEFKWINLKELNTIDFRPDFLINKLMSKNFKFEHKIEFQAFVDTFNLDV